MSLSKFTLAPFLFIISLNALAFQKPPSALTSSLIFEAVSALAGIEQSIAAFSLAERMPDDEQHDDTLWVAHLGYIDAIFEVVPIYLSLILIGIYAADEAPHLSERAFIPRNLAFAAQAVCSASAALNVSSLIFAFQTLNLVRLNDSTKFLFWSMTSASALSLAANLGAIFSLRRLGVMHSLD